MEHHMEKTDAGLSGLCVKYALQLINIKIGAFLAQSADWNGGVDERNERFYEPRNDSRLTGSEKFILIPYLVVPPGSVTFNFLAKMLGLPL